MAKHMTLAKVMKMLKRQGEHATTVAERNRIAGLNNPNGRHTYGLRMHRAANNPGSGPCPGGCGRKTSIGRLCLSCAKTEEESKVIDNIKEALGI